jgi:hypothetical protein
MWFKMYSLRHRITTLSLKLHHKTQHRCRRFKAQPLLEERRNVKEEVGVLQELDQTPITDLVISHQVKE